MNGPLRVGIGGPVGAGKTTLTEKLCQALAKQISMAVVTNDIFTSEDAMALREAAVLPVRRQIASDRLALQSVGSVDLNGTYFRLEAINERIASRQWSPAERLEPREQSNETPLSWQAFRDSLSSLVTVSRLDVPYQAPPLLSEFAQWQQHSLLLTEQVQLALLARNQPLYNEALAQLQSRVAVMSAELELDAIETELDALQGLTLTPDFPDIHASVEALEQYMTRVEEESTESAGDGEEDA